MSGRPPSWARHLAALLVRGPRREFILGDLDEMHARYRGGRVKATLAYLSWTARSGLAEGLRVALAGFTGDLRIALRQLRRHPRVHVGAALVLTVGLGVSTWAFGMRHGAVEHGLPVSEPDRMLTLRAWDSETREMRWSFSRADLGILEEVPGLELLGLWRWTEVAVDDLEGPSERVEALRVTPSMFDLLELRALRGRVLQSGDGTRSGPQPVVMAHRFWIRRFDGDPSIVGRALDIDGRPAVVVGVLPPAARMQAEDLWLPVDPEEDRDLRASWLLARSRPDVDDGALAAALRGIGLGLASSDGSPGGGTLVVSAVPFARAFSGDTGDVHLRVVVWAGGLLFVMALANVANLYLVRARARTRELQVRRALGASRIRVVRQLAIEAAVPGGLGILGGALVASWGLEWYQRARDAYGGAPGPVWQVYRLEAGHLAVLACGALLSTVVVSLLAGLGENRRTGDGGLRASRGTTSSFPLGRGLVAVEIAVGGALLLLASLMLRSAWNLRTVDWGFARESVLTGHVVLDEGAYSTPEDRIALWQTLEREAGALPGVASASLATQLPMIRYAGEWGALRPVEIEGIEPAALDEIPRHYVDAVSASFFETFEAPVERGRSFGPRDHARSEPVAIVNVPFARRYFPGGEVLGRRLRVWNDGEPGAWRTVVGVAPHLWMDTDENQRPQGVYVPLRQAAPPEASVALRDHGDPAGLAPDLRRLVGRLAPGVPVDDLMTMPELIRFRTRLYRREGPPFVWIGVAALLLAVAGLYVVISYIASLRTAELGVRAALGASRLDLVGRAVGWVIPPLAVGIGAGILTGLWLTRGFSRFLFLVEPWSAPVAIASFGVLAGTSVAAALLPAVRASRIDLARTLKAE